MNSLTRYTHSLDDLLRVGKLPSPKGLVLWFALSLRFPTLMWCALLVLRRRCTLLMLLRRCALHMLLRRRTLSMRRWRLLLLLILRTRSCLRRLLVLRLLVRMHLLRLRLLRLMVDRRSI